MSQAAFYSDLALEHDVSRLEQSIEQWARRHDIWHDCGFTNYADHVDGEPGEQPVVTILYFNDQFYSAITGWLETEFLKILDKHEFFYETSLSTLQFYPDEGRRCEAYANYHRWRWICSLVQPDFADVHEELYAHFAARPEDLHRLDWRQFEIFLARIFQTQGFVTELGPGRGDGGVDIRLLQRDPIGDIMTFVQAKKYAPHRSVGLEAVAALSGIAGVEGAQRSIFVTTSSYQPVARRFAARTSGALELRASRDIVDWCQTANQGIIQDKSSLVSAESVERLLLAIGNRADPRIVHARCGYGITANKFALVIKETRHAALLMGLPNHVLSHDGYGQRGFEIPLLDSATMDRLNADCVWRAKRTISEGGAVRYWDGSNLYRTWDGIAAMFDHYD